MKKYGKLALLVLAFCFALYCFRDFCPIYFAETVSRVKQSKFHNQTYANVLRPTAAWVAQFRAAQGRLPLQSEVNEFLSARSLVVEVLIYTNPAASEPKWEHPGTDFELCSPIAGWNFYY